MLKDVRLNQPVFIDIETVPRCQLWSELPEKEQQLWKHKARHLSKDETSPEVLYKRAGIYAEFGKIICISTGRIRQQNGAFTFHLKSFSGDDELLLLEQFAQWLSKQIASENRLCAHNGKEFDFPYVARRMLINGVSLPKVLDTAGKKPWEVNHIDTLELWKFGDYKHYISLDQLAWLFGIPSPKSDITGADVGEVYWNDKDLARIQRYCEQDVTALAQIICRFKQVPLTDVEWPSPGTN